MAKREAPMWRVAVEYSDGTFDVFAYRAYGAAREALGHVMAAIRADPRGFCDVELIDPFGEVVFDSAMGESFHPARKPLAAGCYRLPDEVSPDAWALAARIGEPRPL